MKHLPGAMAILVMAAACSPTPPNVRLATFNVSLNRPRAGQLVADLSGGHDSQARRVAAIVQSVRPDILLLNEFDHDSAGEAAGLFNDLYLAVPQGDGGGNGSGDGQHAPTPRPPAAGLRYPYWFTASVNTGVPSGTDLDRDGVVDTEPGSRGYGGDALGFGVFPGQYGMVVYSRFPIVEREVRTFQNFLWRDMPGASLPTDPDSGDPWYGPDQLAVLPLSSKSHWDVPVRIAGRVVHLLVSHPTPPVFDGPEDRNGRRNHDEIRFWRDYVTPDSGGYIYDDHGVGGGLEPGARFVIMGDQNSDPNDGDSFGWPIDMLLDSPAIDASTVPRSSGGAEAARLQGEANEGQQGDPAFDTGDFPDAGGGPGNLRLDYVLPSRGFRLLGSGVFWPPSADPAHTLIGASDHRLVWLDLTW